MTTRSFVTADGVRIVYDDFGPQDATTVVLCHGMAVRGSQFGADAAWLAERGFRVLVPDLRGHGRSETPGALTRETLGLERMGADLIAMLDDAGAGQVHWVGNSLGGIIGLSLLPARRFLSLTTFGTAFRLQLLTPWFLTAWVRMSYFFLTPRAIARLMAWIVSRDRGAQQIVADMIEASRPKVTASVIALASRYDFFDNVRRSGVPVLLLDCAEDWLVNWAMGSTLRSAPDVSNVTLVRLAAGGHCANLDAPDAFREALLAFWAAGREAPRVEAAR